jgi:hypothetical protein
MVATKREPSAWGYNWATLFLGDINMATWPSRLIVSNLRKQNVVMSSAGLGPENDCWRGPAAIVNDRPFLSSERLLHKDMTTSVHLGKKLLCRLNGLCRQDKLIGCKPPVVN